MGDGIIFECKGSVLRFNPKSEQWNPLQNNDVSCLFIIGDQEKWRKEFYVVASSQRQSTPFLSLSLEKGTSYARSSHNPSWDVLKVPSKYGVEIFGFNVLPKSEAERFSYHLQDIMKSIYEQPPYQQQRQQHNNRIQTQTWEQLHHPKFQTLNSHSQYRMPGMPYQGTMPKRYEPMTMPPNRYINDSYAIKPAFMYGNDEHDYHEYKELEPEFHSQNIKDHEYEMVYEDNTKNQMNPFRNLQQDQVQNVSSQNNSIHALDRSNTNIVKQENATITNQQMNYMIPNQQVGMDTINTAENGVFPSEKIASASAVPNKLDKDNKVMPERKPIPVVFQNHKNPTAKDEHTISMERQSTVVENSKNNKNFHVSKLDMMCDMLAEAIDNGNIEKSKEIVSELASQKAKITIQSLFPEEEAKFSEFTINITVQVEDRQTTTPTLIKMNVDPSRTTIGKLKYQVYQSYKFPIKVQRWVVGKRLPKDHETLKSLDVITTGTVIFLYLLSARKAGLVKDSPNKDVAQETQATTDHEPKIPPRDYPINYQNNNPLPDIPHNPNFHESQSVPTQISNVPNFHNTPQLPLTGPCQNETEARHRTQQEVFNSTSTSKVAVSMPPNIPEIFKEGESLRETPLPVLRLPPPLPPRRQGWTCDRCTFVNIPTRPGCEMCGLDRPADYVPPQDLQIDQKEHMRLLKEKELERLALELETRTREEERSAALRNFQNTLDTAHLNLIPNPEEFECSICYGEIQVGEGALLRECLHSFCRDCLKEHIKACEDPEVRCPFNDGNVTCNEVITTQEISALLPEMEFLQYLDKSLNTAENKATNSFHCKTPNCKGWCYYEDAVNWFLCQICNKRNCLTCKAIHENLTCKQYQDDLKRRSQIDDAALRTQQMLDDMVKKGDAMKCPQCEVILQKKDGCDWLRCSMCRTEICWVTRGRRWGPGGHGDISGGCKCRANGKPCHPNCGNCH